ncbi:MAG: type II CAAX endopeptidase family protein [Verrucomicrobiota bacterium]
MPESTSAYFLQHPQPSRTEPSKSRLWAAVLPALVVPLLASLIYFVFFPGTWFGKACFALVKIHLIAWPIIATIFILKESLSRPAPTWKTRFHTLIPGVLIGVTVVASMFALMLTPLGDIVRASGGSIKDKVEDLGMLKHYIEFSIFISLFNSLIEECYWRWFAYGTLRRLMPRTWAHILAALAFSAHHIVVVSQFFPLSFALFVGFSVGVGGLIWSLMYQKYNTILGPWVCHIIIDAGFLWIVYDLFFRDV